MENPNSSADGSASPTKGAKIRVLGAPSRIVEAAAQSRVQNDPLGVDIVADGLIPKSVEHDIDIFDATSDYRFRGWKGGVYDRNREICSASLSRRDFSFITAPYHRDEIDPEDIQYIAGDALYGGLAFKHFGHFFLESTNRLWWPIIEGYKGPIVFQNTRGRFQVPAFAQRFLELLGFENRVIVTDKHLRFDRVIVPHSAFTIRESVHPLFQKPFLVAAEAAERYSSLISADVRGGAAGVYLSRTRYDYRRSRGEQRVENAFIRNNFDVFYMETLPMELQMLVTRRYDTVAGIAGSALHNILFSDEQKKAIYINRDYDINENFFMIDEMMGNSAIYIYNGAINDAEFARTDREMIANAYHSDITLNVPKIFSLIEESRILPAPWRWRGY